MRFPFRAVMPCCVCFVLAPSILLASMPDSTASSGVIVFNDLRLMKVGKPVVCPKVASLKKNHQHFWQGPGGWKSFSTSFSKQLTHLVGVQWQGKKVGKIFCVYKDDSKLTFPVNLQGPGIYLAPKVGDSWKQAQNTIVCKDTMLTTCAFQEVKQMKPSLNSKQDVESFLQGIKQGIAEDNN